MQSIFPYGNGLTIYRLAWSAPVLLQKARLKSCLSYTGASYNGRTYPETDLHFGAGSDRSSAGFRVGGYY